MKNKYSTSDKFFIGFGFITIISGVLLVIQKDYLMGISGFFVGLLVTYQSFQNSKKKNNE